jgi:hypothetical protein
MTDQGLSDCGKPMWIYGAVATAIALYTHINYTNEHTSLISGRGRRSSKPAGSP